MIGELLTFPVHADKDGSLVALEKGDDFPFEIKRVYNVWREFTHFSPDCVVMVLASEHYNEADYIRNYGDFLKSIGKSRQGQA